MGLLSIQFSRQTGDILASSNLLSIAMFDGRARVCCIVLLYDIHLMATLGYLP